MGEETNSNGQNGNGNGHKPPQNGTKSGGLTTKQRRFAQEFSRNGGNGTKAALAAGYGTKSAHVAANRTLRNDKVREYIAQQAAICAAAAGGVTTTAVLGALARLALYDPGELLDRKGIFDFKKCRRKGLTFVIKEIEVTERHTDRIVKDAAGKPVLDADGNRKVVSLPGRTTVKYKLHDKQAPLETLVRVLGMEKQAAKNPRDAALEALQQLKTDYPDLQPGQHERIIAKSHGVPLKDLTGADQPTH